MKRIYILLLTIILASFFINSCKSPMDIDTPRDKTLVGRVKISPSMTQMTMEENGSQKYFVLKEAFAEIDTSARPPAIWIKLSLELNNYPFNAYNNRINISYCTIHIDSLGITGAPITLTGSPGIGSWSSYTLQRGEKPLYDTIVYSGIDRNYSDITFTMNKDNKEIWTFIYSKIYNLKFWVETRDTVITDNYGNKISIPIETQRQANDSLIFKGNFKFQY